MVKLKYVVKMLPIYMVKAKYMVKFYMIKLKYMVKQKLWSFPHIWSNMKQIYSQNSRRSPYIIVTDMTYLLVNWTDVTSTESQPESAFANKIRDRPHKRPFTRYVVSFTDPPPLGRSLGISLALRFVGLAHGTI